MSLNFREKRQLQKTVAEQQAALRGGNLSFREKRQAQKAMQEALTKLGAGGQAPAATPSLDGTEVAPGVTYREYREEDRDNNAVTKTYTGALRGADYRIKGGIRRNNGKAELRVYSEMAMKHGRNDEPRVVTADTLADAYRQAMEMVNSDPDKARSEADSAPVTRDNTGVGDFVEWRNENGTIRGSFRGFTDDGAGVVIVANGSQMTAPAGEVFKPGASDTPPAKSDSEAALEASSNLAAIRPFLPQDQFKTLAGLIKRGEEKEAFRDKVSELKARIEGMPVTYEQDGKGMQAIVYLHYFSGGNDYYITEKDMDGNGAGPGAFGYAMAQENELGYINIPELVKAGVELDLHFTPRPLAQVVGGGEDGEAEGGDAGGADAGGEGEPDDQPTPDQPATLTAQAVRGDFHGLGLPEFISKLKEAYSADEDLEGAKEAAVGYLTANRTDLEEAA